MGWGRALVCAMIGASLATPAWAARPVAETTTSAHLLPGACSGEDVRVDIATSTRLVRTKDRYVLRAGIARAEGIGVATGARWRLATDLTIVTNVSREGSTMTHPVTLLLVSDASVLILNGSFDVAIDGAGKVTASLAEVFAECGPSPIST